jgi:hypothetical protein
MQFFHTRGCVHGLCSDDLCTKRIDAPLGGVATPFWFHHDKGTLGTEPFATVK